MWTSGNHAHLTAGQTLLTPKVSEFENLNDVTLMIENQRTSKTIFVIVVIVFKKVSKSASDQNSIIPFLRTEFSKGFFTIT